jgi:hypothetical protein
MSGLKKDQFLEISRINPHLVPRNPRLCSNDYFYHPNQEKIYNEIYGAKEFNCCPQFSISMDKLRSKPEYFGEALEICEEQGLIPLITFTHNYSKEVICQFYGTVVFIEDEFGFRSLKWMTKEHVMEATCEEFANGIGYRLHKNCIATIHPPLVRYDPFSYASDNLNRDISIFYPHIHKRMLVSLHWAEDALTSPESIYDISPSG